MRLIEHIVPAAAIVLCIGPCLGQCSPTEVQTLAASDGRPFDEFGYSVAISGDTAIIGAWLADNPGAEDSGAAYIYTLGDGVWVLAARLAASDGKAGDWFGFAVAIDGDTAVVGAREADSPGVKDSGAAYVFVRSGDAWTEQAKLVAPSGETEDLFGDAVAIRGDTVLAGAPFDDTEAGTQAGSVYVFGRADDAWTLRQTLQGSDTSTGDRFGVALAMSGDSLLVGAFTADSPGLGETGAAYVFTLDQDQWTEQSRLGAPDAEGGDFFGVSVAIDGDTAIVGAPTDDNEWGGYAGSAHIFARDQGAWSHAAMITGPDGAPSDELGWSVAVRGDVALVGAPYDDTHAGHDAGSAVLVARVNGVWAEQDRITIGGDRDYRFGHCAALGEGVALVGAYGAPGPGGVQSGLAFALELNCGPCYPDCDGIGGLDLFDFLCFVNAFNGGDAYADCDGDGGFTLFDFLCYTNAFNAGC